MLRCISPYTNRVTTRFNSEIVQNVLCHPLCKKFTCGPTSAAFPPYFFSVTDYHKCLLIIFCKVKICLLFAATFVLKYVRVSSAVGRPVLPSPASLDNSLLLSAFRSLLSFSLGLAFTTALFLICFVLLSMKIHKRQKRRCYTQTMPANDKVFGQAWLFIPLPLLLLFFSLFRNIPRSSGTSPVQKPHSHFAPRVEASAGLSSTATSNHSLVCLCPCQPGETLLFSS